MKRSTAAVNRLTCGLIGLAAVALGGAAIWWRPGSPRAVRAPFVPTAVNAGWWPWALAAVAVLLVALGGWWLLAQLLYRPKTTAALTDSDLTGQLSVDLGSAARAAAHGLANLSCTESASGRAVSDRGQHAVEVAVKIRADRADLGELARAATSTRADLANALVGTTVATRVLVSVKPAIKTRKVPRVT